MTAPTTTATASSAATMIECDGDFAAGRIVDDPDEWALEVWVWCVAVRGADVGVRPAGAAWSGSPLRSFSRSCTRASGSWGRSSRRFCNIFMTMALNPSERVGQRRLGGSGNSVTCLVMTTIGFAPENGGAPTAMWYSDAPSE